MQHSHWLEKQRCINCGIKSFPWFLANLHTLKGFDRGENWLWKLQCNSFVSLWWPWVELHGAEPLLGGNCIHLVANPFTCMFAFVKPQFYLVRRFHFPRISLFYLMGLFCLICWVCCAADSPGGLCGGGSETGPADPPQRVNGRHPHLHAWPGGHWGNVSVLAWRTQIGFNQTRDDTK